MNRKNVEDIYRLGPVQQGILFHCVYDPRTVAYFEQFHLTAEALAEPDQIAEAWQQVTARHPALRTSFLWEDLDEPVQVVHRAVEVPLAELDLAGTAEAERAEKLAAILDEDRRRGFDLTQAPLLRMTIVRWTERLRTYVLSYHHAIMDGWSFGIAWGEFIQISAGLLGGEAPVLPEPRPLREYIAWLRRQDPEEATAYWRRALEGFEGATPLGWDPVAAENLRQRARGAEDFGQVERVLGEEATNQLRQLARQNRLTLNTVVQAAWAHVLARGAGRGLVFLGTTVSGRPSTLRGAQEMVGCFINTLPVRAEVPAEGDLIAWLRRLQADQVELRRFEHSPLVEVRRWAGIAGDRELFDSIVVFENFDTGIGERSIEGRDERFTRFQRTNYPLTVVVEPIRELFIQFTFDRLRVAAPAVERMVHHLEDTLLALAGGARDFVDLPSAPARDQALLAGWNDSHASFPSADTLAARFARTAAMRPEAPAVSLDGETLTYRELEARANRLARQLVAWGVGPESRVGLVAERSFELVVAIVATVKAGGAYVPFDPAVPPERLAFLIADSGAPVILVGAGLGDRVTGAAPETRIVDLAAALLGEGDPGAPEPGLEPDHLAYVIYTSGSTGRPKGSLLTHRNVLRLFDATAHWFDFGPDDVWTLFHSYAFDFSVWELWGALLHGGRLVVVPYWVSRSPEAFHDLLEREGVTVLNQTPSAFKQLVAADFERPREALARLRTVVFGGEALEPTALAPWYARHGTGTRLINMYGITETTVHVTYRAMGAADSAVAGASPVGVPIPDLQIYLLDAAGRTVPVGVPGEIHVGGAGLARGYLGRAGLTAERFVPNPFVDVDAPALSGGAPGSRLYRSGDLARLRADGELEFLGRIDHQVKIRGFRIELGEIEATLLGHGTVQEVAVLMREDRPGDQRLVAYFVTRPGAEVTVADLKAHAGRRLPDYMVPSAIVRLPALPLTVNGKLDRRALPMPEGGLDTADGFEPPQGGVEEAVATVWAEVLGVPRVGRHDDFFDLGGHSLLATKVAGRLRGAVGLDVPLPALFDHPRLADLAAWIDGQRGVAPADLDIPVLPRATDGASEFVASFAQERLWFLDQLEPGGAVYNLPTAVRLAGPLDLDALAAALGDLVARQESLRTTFAPSADGGPPRQIVAAAGEVPLEVVDLRSLAAEEREEAAAERAATEALAPFDLARGPLCRATALRLADDETALLVTLHHIVSDGWSMDVFVRELAAGYAARVGSGRAAELPPLPIGYADYAAWQRSFLAGDELRRQLDYWRGELEGAPTLLEIPADRPRPAVQSFDGAVASFRLTGDDAAALRARAQEAGATVFQWLLAAYGAFLGRLTGQDDLTVGSPVSGRERPGLEHLIGFFVNTLVLRQRLAGQPGFDELVRRSRAGALAALAHQDVPFEKLVEELAPARSLASTPLFQAMLVFQNPETAEASEGARLELRGQRQEIRISKFDLTLSVLDLGRDFAGHWAYRTDLFDAATVERYDRAFDTFLAAALADPAAPFTRLPLLADTERRQILVEWNRPRLDHPSDGFVHQLFAARAAAGPERVAVVFEGTTMSYGELERQANHLAQALRDRGVGPESIVGVLAERSFELPVALLAVLKAGGAYLPLDPDLPAERLAFMIEDSRVGVVLAQAAHADLLAGGGAEILILDEPLPEGPTEGKVAPPDSPLQPENAAYVIYTSGSTGRPKGVVVPHGALANRLQFALANDVGPDHAFLQKTTISFDVSVLEIFAPLLAGGRTVLAKPRGQSDLAYLVELIERERITHTSFPPTLLYALFEEDGFAHLGSLESVVTGGETVPAELPDLFYAAVGATTQSTPLLFNRYGPTEATISVTSWTCRPGQPERVLPIGWPTAKAEVYLLDRELQPVPVGVPGEVHLGGPCLARGYLGRPDKTAESFVPDPFSGHPGARLYKTGDLARYRPDGALEFVGRIDNQVKIRGFRIELGEIESVLARHPDVREAAVLDWGEGAGKTLAAYLVGGTDRRPGDLELKEELAASLPAYMVPTAFLWLDRLPLSPSGKIDRKALPAPEVGTGDVEPPLGPTEELVAGVWQNLLGVAAVGRHSDFFDLGGHSLLATRVVARIRELLDVELPLRVLFEQPTVKALAKALEAARAGAAGAVEEPILRLPRPSGAVATFPLSFGQRRLWFLDRLEPGNAAYNLPATVRLRGDLDYDALGLALDALAARHESLRTTFGIVDGELVQKIAPVGRIPVTVVDLSGLPESVRVAEATRRAEKLAERVLDLANGPLVHVEILRVGPEDHLVQVLMHHIVTDGWSMGLFFVELMALYHGYRAGQPPVLPPLPIDYADYSVWQTRQLTGEALEGKLAHWRERLAGAPALLPLPTDHPRPAVQRFAGAQHRLDFDAALTAGLGELARGHGATLFMALYGLFSALLSRVTGTDDLVVGTPIAGRRHAETEPLIGLFLNTLALRLDLSGDPTAHEILTRARATTLDAYGYQDLPFEMVVDDLQPERSLSHAPIFQVLLVLQNTPVRDVEVGGLELQAVRVEGTTAKFDLTLTFGERGDLLASRWDYNRDLFEESTVERFARRFEALLRAVVANPELRLSGLPLLLPEEETQLRSWNATAVDYGASGETLVSLFEAQVDRTGEAVAVVLDTLTPGPSPASGRGEEGEVGASPSPGLGVLGGTGEGDRGGEGLTYADLDRRANQLAHRLRRLGVGPEVKVGIAAERSLELVVGLYGILKAGGAYVPIDPSYPEDRIAYMLADAGVPVLLTQAHLVDRLPAHGATVVRLDDPTLGDEPDTRPERLAGPDHLAYTIYTSGSTGRPKGAMNAHRGIVNRLLWMQAEYGLDATDRVLQKTPFSFDVSVWEFFWPLLVGAQLVVAKPEGHKDPAYLVDVIERAGVTTLHFVPSMLQVFVETPGVERCTSLRRVMASGEALPADLVQRHYQRLATPLHNLYGPTEAAVDVTYWPTSADDPAIPIGHPVANTRIHIVDAHGHVAPVGVAGELLIGGVQVGRGYHGRPALTAERFVPDPFSDVPGARLYRTGDLSRWVITPSPSRPDALTPGPSPASGRGEEGGAGASPSPGAGVVGGAGEGDRGGEGSHLEYLGRIDFQVKIRGFRIELGEIEAALAAQPGVREAVVAVRTVGGGPALVAYLTGADLDPAAFAPALAARLPEYMVPAHFVVLPELPLNPSGKVDRKRLPEPELRARSTERTAPRNALETALVALWATRLATDDVGVDDNFFALGGNSIGGALLINELQEKLGEIVHVVALFDCPTPATMAAFLEREYPDSVHRLSAVGSFVPAAGDLTAGDWGEGDSLPLSFGQERLWFLEQLGAGGAAYHLPTALALTGALDVPALGRALTALAARHASLRTTFVVEAAGPVQRVVAAAPVDLERIVASDPAAAEAAALEVARRPFDLATEHPFRAALVRRGPEDHLLVMVLHHIVSDGWSLGLAVRELAALYGAFVEGRSDPLPRLVVQYPDFARWQRGLFAGSELGRQLDFWTAWLAALPPLELPTDRPRPAHPRYRGAEIAGALPNSAATALLELGRSEGASAFLVLQTLFATLLARFSGQHDFAVGTPVAGRNRRELEPVIGFFVNTLALRQSYTPEESFRTALGRAREAFRAALEHQDVPFEFLVEALQPERHLSRSPLFQVMFSLQDLPGGAVEETGLAFRPVELEVSTAKFDLTLAAITGPGRVSLRWVYDTDLFDAATVERLAAALALLAEGVAADPERPLGQLDLLSVAERAELVVAAARAATAYPADQPLARLIEERVDRAPDAVAVVAGEERLTFGELDTRANQIAHRLIGFGCGPEQRVGVVLERGIDLVPTLLGVLKSGAAYVPVDPGFPAERMAFVLGDASVRVVVTEAALVPSVAALVPAGARLLVLGPGVLAGAPTARPAVASAPDSVAYVLYTSGSTGRPKGVAVPQQAIVNFLVAMAERPGFDTADTLLAVTTVSFDIAALELFLPLLSGGRVVVATRAETSDGDSLRRLLESSSATHLQATPATWRLLLEAGWRPARGFTALCGGEALARELARELARGLAEAHGTLWNLYGPTETTVWSAATRVLDESGPVPFGEPIANTELWVVDRPGLPVPTGVAGELLIGGEGLARGYLGRPALTAERFVPDPFSGRPGARLYRTGDRVRRRTDGRLDFLGRLDFQVKLRGFRIELGEIESALAANPEVRECVVSVRTLGGEPALVAYLTPVGNAEIDPGALRSALRARLPEYMVPAQFVVLAEMPLNTSGKIDRKQLPEPDLRAGAAEIVAPRTPLEAAVMALFASRLETTEIGVDDNFFALGGNSIAGALLINELQQKLGESVRVIALFDAPTPAGLAAFLEREYPASVGRLTATGELEGEWGSDLGDRQGAPAGWLIPRVWKSGDLVPLSYGQERLWFLDRLDPGNSTYNLPAALRIRGPLDLRRLQAACQQIVDRHVALRTTIVLGSEGPRQRVADHRDAILPLLDASALPPREREGLMKEHLLEEADRPFDLEEGPLFRLLLVRLAPEEHALLMVFHHIVSDGWSLGIVVQELAELYQAAGASRPPRLPELPVTYPDFAVWQRQWLAGDDFDRQLAYWRGALEGAPPLLDLPTDRPRPTVVRYHGADRLGRWSHALTDALEQLCRESGATLFVGLVAVFDTLLARLSGSDDIMLGTPTAGRSRSEIEHLVGLFLNTLVLRVRVRPAQSCRELLEASRTSIVEAFAHQEVPFEQLLGALEVERSLAHSPIFQHLLVLQNTTANVAPSADLEFEWIHLETSVAKFDFTIGVSESKTEGVLWHWRYNSDLFDEVTVERMIERLELIAQGLVADPDRPIASLPVMLPREVKQLTAWNATAVDYEGREETLVSLFEAQVDRMGGAVAVVMDTLTPGPSPASGRGEEGGMGASPSPGLGVLAGAGEGDRGGEGLTYAELDRRANQLAHRLRRLGVGPEVKVGIAAERSLELVIGLYGILKAGGAYVPIDPAYPEDRIAYMLADAGVPVLLTEAHRVAELPAHEATVVLLDDPALEEEPATRPRPLATAGHLAYTIYTSGSTGRPKGAMNTHRGIVNRLLWMQAEYRLDETDRVLQKTPVSFDVSVWEFFWPLLAGAQLVVAKPEGHKDPGYLADVTRRAGITTLHFVPSMLQVFLEAPGVESCTGLRRVLASGEALPADLVRRYYQQLAAPLHNLYGPTEAAVDVTYWPTSPDEPSVPIGLPVANTRIHIVDANLGSAPVGVAGELLIGGVQVGRGYHGRPALTAERFIPDPFSDVPGARLYRTGDLARWQTVGAGLRPAPAGDEGGRVEYLGRIDFQVKIRGFRIELGEIEAALADQPSVREAVVLARADGASAGPTLVAYLVAEGAAPGAAELRAALAQRLPDYMVPAAYVVLEAMPLNPSGKVDRKKLPAPERLGEEQHERIAPRTPVETYLFEIWSRLLQRRDFGVLDDFFALGGNSLLGAIFINEIQKRLGEIVHVVTLFDRSTLERFAEYLETEHETAVAHLVGTATGRAPRSRPSEARVDGTKIETIRALIPHRRAAAGRPGTKNPRAAFVLAPPRSGTTLLRVMLGGHPQLFAPPELELLPYTTLAERRAAFAGPQAYRLEGVTRAVVQLTGESADEAQARLERMADEGVSVADFYLWMQNRLGGRLLVDKTPTYAWDPATLAAGEELFEEPLYIHLVRHPYGMIRSFEEARIDQVFWRTEQPYTRRELAEILWTVAHQNIASFFAGIPAERRLEVHFEQLVREPEAELERLSHFLGIEYVPAMANPYEDKKSRMTDGLRAESRMIGDVKFHQYRGVDSKTADQWRTAYDHDFLGEDTWAIADSLGLAGERVEAPGLPASLVPLAPGEAGQPPLFLIHPVSGDVFFYRHLARELGGAVPVFGFEAPGRERPTERLGTIEALAEHYVDSLLDFQKEGPYLLAGSSMGGAIAFEMARRLDERGRPVAFVGLLDAVHPTDLAVADLGEGVRSELALLRFLTGGGAEDVTEDSLAALDGEARLELILDRARTSGATLPAGFGTAELGALVGLIKANQRALAAYRPGPYGGPVHFFRAGTPLAYQTRPTEDAWRESIQGELEVIVTPGTHLSMNFPPHVGTLAIRLRKALARVLEGVAVG
jgi:amino acid adenylation domain-containing protein